MSNKIETKKKQKRIPTGYSLSSSYYGKYKKDQTGTLRTGKYTENGLSLKAGVIYKKGSPHFNAIENLSTLLRRKMFIVATFELVDIE